MFHTPKSFGEVICRSITDDSFCPLHYDIYDILYRKPRYAVIIAPRGHAKTSTASTIGTLYDLAYDLEDYIILIKKSYPQAVMDLRNIKMQLRHNQRFQSFFGRFEEEIWREDTVVVRNPHTGHRTMIQSLGFEQEVRGRLFENKRPTKEVLDDFESKRNTMTPEMRRKLKENVREDYMPSLDPKKGSLFAIGTIVHADSWLYNTWKASERGDISDDWIVVFRQAVENGDINTGKVLWPERYSRELLLSLLKDYDRDGMIDSFYQEYLNLPISDQSRQFKNILYFDDKIVVRNGMAAFYLGDDKYRPVNLFLGVDPALGVEKGDRTGAVILACDADNKRYVHIAEGLRVKADGIIDKMFDFNKQYPIHSTEIESVQFQAALKLFAEQRMITDNTWFHINEVRPLGNRKKEERIYGLQPYFNAGNLYIRPEQKELFQELHDFPKGKHDDIMDALYYANAAAYPPDLKEWTPEGEKDDMEYWRKLYSVENDWRAI